MARSSYRLEYVWRLIDQREPGECWYWAGHIEKNGYGRMRVQGRNYAPHRIVCYLKDKTAFSLTSEKKNTKDSKFVMHSCDNKLCCNPTHLSVGSPKENTADMIRKGRKAKLLGENSPRAKLSHADVERIRESRIFGAVQKDLAKVYAVSAATISTACRGIYYSCAPSARAAHRNKLTTEEVRQVRGHRKSGATMKAISILYGVKLDVIKDVIGCNTYLRVV